MRHDDKYIKSVPNCMLKIIVTIRHFRFAIFLDTLTFKWPYVSKLLVSNDAGLLTIDGFWGSLTKHGSNISSMSKENSRIRVSRYRLWSCACRTSLWKTSEAYYTSNKRWPTKKSVVCIPTMSSSLSSVAIIQPKLSVVCRRQIPTSTSWSATSWRKSMISSSR